MFYIRDSKERELDWEYNIINAIAKAKKFIQGGKKGVHIWNGEKKVWGK